MYDNVCKFLAEAFTSDLATWLLGSPVPLTQLSPNELSLEPIRADSLSFLAAHDLILHVEFQTQPDPQIPFRMTDYRLRAHRKFPQKEMHQVVVYLQLTGSPLVQETSFNLSKTRHEFEVIRLWEQPTEIFFNSPGLLAFAVLSSVENPTVVLNQVAQAIQAIPERQTQSNVTGCVAILAGLILDRQIIRRILQEEIMQESVIYQEILQQGREQGREQGVEQVAINLLREGMILEQVVRLTGLPLEKIQSLQQALAPE